MQPQGAAAYKSKGVQTASPAQLVLMLFDGGLAAIRSGRAAMVAGDHPTAHTQIIKAEAIVSELRCSLNMDIDVATNLDAIYGYAYNKLVQANLAKEPGHLDEVERMLEPLRDAWKESCVESGIDLDAPVGVGRY